MDKLWWATVKTAKAWNIILSETNQDFELIVKLYDKEEKHKRKEEEEYQSRIRQNFISSIW